MEEHFIKVEEPDNEKKDYQKKMCDLNQEAILELGRHLE